MPLLGSFYAFLKQEYKFKNNPNNTSFHLPHVNNNNNIINTAMEVGVSIGKRSFLGRHESNHGFINSIGY